MNRTNTGLARRPGAIIGTPATTVTGPDAFGDSPIIGLSTDYAREDHDHGLPAAPGAHTLAQVMAAGNDTGGLPVINDTTIPTGAANTSIISTAIGLDTANADQLANTVDNIASAVGTATATGNGGADVRRTATANGGDAHAEATAITSVNGSAFAETNAIATGAGDATTQSLAITLTGNAASGSAAQSSSGNADVSSSALTTTGQATAGGGAVAATSGGYADANLSATVASAGAGVATASLAAAKGASFTKIATIATPTGTELQVNNLPLYTTAAAPPGGTFVSLFYVDSTALTGGAYLWDFVAAAYVRISGAF